MRIRNQLAVFLVRWSLNSLGIWVAVRLLGSGYGSAEQGASVSVFLLAGLIFSLVNTVLKPIVIILSLPAILLTLGLFTLIVNGLMVYISLQLTPGLTMSFANSIVAGIILGLVNYIVSSALELRRLERKS
ncbi:hypothetical protein B7Y94_00465 [Candidatus Saccharibacteria bacterium 32-49-12]|nr:MAG: hypothetical protein B7Y94_00465 [Candidatus Saccharibacteria bacterium 32-49-12]